MNLGPFFWTPTISVLYNNDYIRDNPEVLDDPRWHEGLPDSIVRDIQGSLAHFDRLPYYQLTPIRKPTLDRKFQQIKASGSVLLIGTDSGVPGFFHSQSTWNEMDIWVRNLGMDPMETIRAATYWPSVFMGVADDVGTVSEGKYADIIAVRGDVLRHMSILQDVDVVIKHGIRYK
jgi:predicted amidohydrolase YtcJ